MIGKLGVKVTLKRKVKKKHYNELNDLFSYHTYGGKASKDDVRGIVSCIIATEGIGTVLDIGGELEDGRIGNFVKVNFQHKFAGTLYEYDAYFDPDHLKVISND
jgi:hypothetical protein